MPVGGGRVSKGKTDKGSWNATILPGSFQQVRPESQNEVLVLSGRSKPQAPQHSAL